MNSSSSSIANSFFSASHQNEEGIHYLESANFAEAISAFSESLSVMKQLLSVHHNQDEVTDISPQPETYLPAYFVQRKEWSKHAAPLHHGGSYPFIFRNPIIFNVPEVERLCHKSFAGMSYTILYNLALTHHLKAIEDDNGISRKHLRKSLWLYEAANAVRIREKLSLTVTQNMALVNNIGYIHSVLKNEEKAQECFEILLSTMMVVKDCGEREAIEQLDGFLVNVTPLILEKQTSAVAA